MDSIKNERITARVTGQVKNTLSVAANIMGATLNQFLIQAALEKAENIIERDKIVYLSKEDIEIFFNALDNPPPPNKNLIDAFKNYSQKIG